MTKPAIRVCSALLCFFLAAACSSDAEKMQAYSKKGQAYFEKGDYRAAAIEFKNAIQIDPGNVAAHLKLAAVYLKLGDFSSAYQQYSDVIRLDPSNIPALLKLAVFNLHDKKYDQCRKQVKAILAREPDHLEALYVLAGLHRAGRRWDQAAALYRQIIHIDPGQQPAYLGLADCTAALGKLDRAEAYLDQAEGVAAHVGKGAADTAEGPLAFKPRFAEVFRKLANGYLERKAYAAAIAMCERQLALPGYPPETRAVLFHARGDIFLVQGEAGEAERSYRQAISADADYLPAYHALTRIYLAHQAPNKAYDIYLKALKDHPRHIRLRMELASLYDEQGEDALAERQYRRILADSPDDAPAANNLAFLLANKSAHLDEALKLARLAREKLPRSATVMDTLGWVYFQREAYEPAIEQFRQSVQEEPGKAVVHYHLGLAYERTNQLPEAVTELEKALAIDGNFPQAEQARRRLADLRKSPNP